MDRLNDILNAIINVAQGDYSVEIEVTDSNDDLDALAMGINLMVNELKDKFETEKENERILNLNEQLKIASLQAKESDRLKSAFLANMSHEIRTPMNSILGFAGLLKKTDLSEENRKKYVEHIEKGGGRMLNLINELIDISKIESGQMDLFFSKTNVLDVMESTYLFFKSEAESKEIELKWNRNGFIPGSSIINTDKVKLEAILNNLIKNAIKFTDKGVVELGIHKIDEFIEFYVKDTGIGIPDDKQDVVFERFSQVKDPITSGYEGSGLGLAISSAYTEMLGGRMWMESIEGEGSTFYFTIKDRL